MKISLNWIKDFVDLEGISVDELAERFILSVAEIEDIEYKGNNIKNCVAAKVLKCDKHPDSNKLKVLLVDIGNENVQVVCGAPNVREGIVLPFVKVGGSNQKISKVQSTTLCGKESNGVCCSAYELGISDDNSGIMILDENIKPGTDIKDVIPIDDIIFEIDNKSLTHRPDLWGHYGIAREIAAITGRSLKPINLDGLEESNGKLGIKVSVQEPEKCFRYSCLSISNICKKTSAIEMQVRLFYCGMRTKDLLVDLTNYIMLELGQPLHAFDSRKVREIYVKCANKQEKFYTLDKEEHILNENMLMICNESEPIAIAGVMGGIDSEVENDTNSIILESANFNGISVRKTALDLGIRTEASTRFEKMIDPELTITAIKRFIYLLKQIDNNISISSGLTDIYLHKYAPVVIDIDKAYIENYIGISITEEKIISILESLEFKIEKQNGSLRVYVPTFRATKDISIKADIVEEVSRIYGYDNIQSKTYLSELKPLEVNKKRVLEHKIKEFLSEGFGFSEIHSYVWYDNDLNKKFGFGDLKGIKIINSISGTNSVLRSSMVPSMLYAADLNKKNFSEFGIFEIGSTFDDVLKKGLVNEHKKLCVLLASREIDENTLFYRLKGIINSLLLNMKNIEANYKIKKELFKWNHPVKSADIVADEKELGYMGLLHPIIGNNIDKKLNVAFAELDLDLLNEISLVNSEFKDVAKYPEVNIDFTFLVDKNEPFEKTFEVLNKFKGGLIKDIKFVTLYDGKGIKEGKKSLTFNFLVASDEKTLSGEDIEDIRNKLLSYLDKNGYKLR